MATREEIREGIAELSYYNGVEPRDITLVWESVKRRYPDVASVHYMFADKYLLYLHVNDVVIKVDRELPDIEEYCQLIQGYNDYQGRMSGYRSSQQDMLRWHNDNFEPLIQVKPALMRLR